MNFNPVDPGKMIVLMVFGGIFALVGLWLILRPKGEANTAKFELFGLKFESSSAGVLVFLCGVVFLVLPLFVEERATAMPAKDGGDKAEIIRDPPHGGGTPDPVAEERVPPPEAETPGSGNETGTAGGEPDSLPPGFSARDPVMVEGAEAEENDTPAGANRVPLGSSTTGAANLVDGDYFRVLIPEGYSGEISMTLTGYFPRLNIFNGFSEPIFSEAGIGDSSVSWRGTVPEGGVLILVKCNGAPDGSDALYTLTVAERR